MNESKRNFQLLFDFCLPLAKELLCEQGEFIPFGARLDARQVVSLVVGDIGVERPKSIDVIDFLASFFRSEAKREKIVTAAICCIAERSSQDVAMFQMSDISGDAISVFLPYDMADIDHPEFGAVFASKEEHNFLSKLQ